MPIPPEANVRLKVEADITKRSKPVRSAKAALTRFGPVLRGTMRPSELHLWQLHCKTLPSAPRRFDQRLAAVPRPGFAGPYAKGVTSISGVPFPAAVPSSSQPSAGLSPPGRRAPFPPIKGKAVCSRQSVALPKGAPQQPPAHCIWSVPPTPRGDNRPGAACQRDRKCLESTNLT